MVDLLQEMAELRLIANVKLERHCRADEMAQRAEDERKAMVEQLSKALGDWATAEESAQTKQERASDLPKELATLQEQRRTTEKIWSKEVSRLKGQLLV